MNSYIKAIIIFDKEGKKSFVGLKRGVNIITGESKTGKSALVEIIDYCLCSSRCTVPKGKITDFAYLYVLPMFINGKTLIISRKTWSDGGKMILSSEDENFDPETLTLDYFIGKRAITCKEAQYEIEKALGLMVSNIPVDGEEKGKKASLRNMVSYLFQHQNLMASKFALFYRFSDYYKRKDIIQQFPVFSGMISQSFYSELIELESLKMKLKGKKKAQKANEKSNNFIKENLEPLLRDYYALLGLEIDEGKTVSQLIELAKELPIIDDNRLINNEAIVERKNMLEHEIEMYEKMDQEILLKIQNIKSTSMVGVTYTDVLKDLQQQTDTSKREVEEYICPLCGGDCKELKNIDREIDEATKWLEEELVLTSKCDHDFAEDLRILNEKHSQIMVQIKNVHKQIKNIENKYLNTKELISKREAIYYAKMKIVLFVEMNESGVFDSVDEDIQQLNDAIAILQEKIDGHDVETKMLNAQAFISKNMNELAKNLDFEDEYRPINLNFRLLDQSFDIYHLQNDHEKIHLYEMGSGANWVSCHIALFLSLLRYFAMQEKSPMPLFLFFDQPSQVYFPQGVSNDKILSQADLMAVNKMYKTIFDEINAIGKDSGILPQIIIVDHVDGENLEIKEEFISYVRKNWRDGDALIKNQQI